MPAALLLLPALALLASAAEDPPADRRDAETRHRVADIPRLVYRPAGKPVRPPLRRSVDLLQLAWEGRGALARRETQPPTPDRRVALTPLPWLTGEGAVAQLVTRSIGTMSEEAALSLVLRDRDRWCAPPLELAPRSRLRLGAVALERSTRLLVSWEPAEGAAWEVAVSAAPPDEADGENVDQPLPEGTGTLCLESRGGAVSVGEPRILTPEPPGTDPRPRWIVLIIEDTLRADALDDPHLEQTAPALARLVGQGQRYTGAVSLGAHTKAALWPLLIGRDLVRIDPYKARYSHETETPLDAIYSRANLPVPHLAQDAGYHTVFLGNNSFLHGVPAFARASNRGRSDTGTVDTIEVLPRIMDRYGDERVFLLYYISAPHGGSSTPRRLYEQLGCGRLEGLEASLCAYRARVAHADEALQALEAALADHGLDGSTFQLLTADHGEIFGDARDEDILLGDRWWGTREGHGATSHWTELHVPLVVRAPGLRPALWPGRVTLLDVVPTLVEAGGFRAPLRLDGSVLPLSGGPDRPPARVVSHGYCTHSVLEGERQLLWWEAECRRRTREGHEPVTHRAELWAGGEVEDTDETAPERLEPLVRAHLRWLAERLPNEVWILDASGLGSAHLTATAPAGHIVDWGPSRSMGRFDRVSPVLSTDGRRLEVDLREYPGLFYVATWPNATPIRLEVATDAGTAPVVFNGPLQLPLDVLGRLVDPGDRPDLWVARAAPDRQPSSGPALRVWRQPFGGEEASASSRAPGELDRVLREWGYIR